MDDWTAAARVAAATGAAAVTEGLALNPLDRDVATRTRRYWPKPGIGRAAD
jgi:hypothetical protein